MESDQIPPSSIVRRCCSITPASYVTAGVTTPAPASRDSRTAPVPASAGVATPAPASRGSRTTPFPASCLNVVVDHQTTKPNGLQSHP